ncbi:hypothetical protein [Lactococcus cremoris]|nr:hypothetical protein [Lactococcus cremoris]
MKNHQYRICYEEWGLVLKVAKSNAFTVINNSEVIIKVSNGFDSDTKRRETNSYLTFDSVEDVKEVSLKPTYKAQSSKSVVKEPEPELVEDDFDNFEEEELSLKPKVKKRNAITDKKINDMQNEFFGRTIHHKILKKITDPRVTTVEHAKQIQDFDYPMSLEMYEVIISTKDKVTKDFGIKKLKNPTFKKKHQYKLDEEINQKREMKEKNQMIFDLKDKTITMYIEGEESKVIDVEYLYDLYSNRLMYKENDSYYTSTCKMSTMLEQSGYIKITEKN